jgi:FKBP-type peptidyl-prolyl cis-trans isomerase
LALQLEFERLIKANNLRIFGDNAKNAISEAKFLEYFCHLATGGKTNMNRMQAEYYLRKMSNQVVIDSISVSANQCDSMALSLAVMHAENFTDQLKQMYALDDKGIDIVLKTIQYANPNNNKKEHATKVGIHTGVSMVYQVVPAYKDDKMFKEHYSFNEANFYAAFCDAASGKQPLFDEMQSRMIYQSADNAVDEKQNAVLFSENKAAGIAFLEENKKKEGVKVTQSGLQYQVLKEGKGAKPSATDKVKVHYEGTLIDGTIFDSSIKRGKPAEFSLNAVIAGWTEGLQLMNKGAKYRFYIPYELAYGAQDRAVIKPFSTLIFDVELLDILK